ncbi:MAG: hydrolase [Desulfobacteraceae bacterium]|nr:hydrolase [Desulfobacteraceae bacterium]
MFKVDDTVLVLIDIQGKLASLMHDKEKLYKNLEIITKSMNLLKVPIVWIEQVPDKLGPTIDEITNNLPDQKPIAKYTFSCCNNDEFIEEIKSLKRKQILLTGIETHICVFQTALDLIDDGYEVGVIADCVSSRTQSNKDIGITRMNQAGVVTTSCEMVLFELMKSTKADGFREITKLIK